MLKVKTYIDKSQINGIGLFADQVIPKGTIIWEKTEGLDLTLESLDYKNENVIDFLKTYCYKHNGKYILCIDNGRFINHSDNPNTDDTSYPYTIAKKDILPHEEITSNYKDFGINSDDNLFNML